MQLRYEFSVGGRSTWVESTAGLPREGDERAYAPIGPLMASDGPLMASGDGTLWPSDRLLMAL